MMNATDADIETLKAAIRDVPDFPKPGIMFKDITPLLNDTALFGLAVKLLAAPYKGRGITKVIGMEARGFIFAAPVALELGAGFTPVRKKGKLPYRTVSVTYDLEYGQDTLQIHEDAVKAGEKILIVDDVLATGGTAKGVCGLVEKLGGKVEAVAMLIELGFLKGRDRLSGYPVESLIKY
ncbi:MAG TPA: adenine phosphoribosyltransferase [Elusimicrobiales bacterium]|nr:adenine phosphoribosyltransferase [Elusimicrobiales bacterium]